MLLGVLKARYIRDCYLGSGQLDRLQWGMLIAILKGLKHVSLKGLKMKLYWEMLVKGLMILVSWCIKGPTCREQRN